MRSELNSDIFVLFFCYQIILLCRSVEAFFVRLIVVFSFCLFVAEIIMYGQFCVCCYIVFATNATQLEIVKNKNKNC